MQKDQARQFCNEPLVQGEWRIEGMRDRVSYSICFGDHRIYRYWLEANIPLAREQKDKGTCLFLMLNPSKANERKPDWTVKKCIAFAQHWGYGTLWICNLFAVRGPDAKEALSHPNPVGPDNDRHIQGAARQADKVVLAWGTSGYDVEDLFLGRVKEIVGMLVDGGRAEKLHRFNDFSNGRGQPRHPGAYGKYELSLSTPCVQFTDDELTRFEFHGFARPWKSA